MDDEDLYFSDGGGDWSDNSYIQTFEGFDYSEGESSQAFSDDQNVDYGFNSDYWQNYDYGAISREADAAEAESSANELLGVGLWNATPEDQTSDFGVVKNTEYKDEEKVYDANKGSPVGGRSSGGSPSMGGSITPKGQANPSPTAKPPVQLPRVTVNGKRSSTAPQRETAVNSAYRGQLGPNNPLGNFSTGGMIAGVVALAALLFVVTKRKAA